MASRENGDDEQSALLPTTRYRRHHDEYASAIPAEEVTKIALKLKYQIETVVPIEIEEDRIASATSGVVTAAVVETAKQAGGKDYKACVVFCLLICRKWFRKQGLLELWDLELYNARALAAERIAKKILEDEEDHAYLLEKVLLQRFAIIQDGEEGPSANVVERAVDLHALHVIGASSYQKCVNHLWKGWLVQDDEDPSRFIPYKNRMNTSYWSHLDPDRMRVPRYQNTVQVIFSILYLVIYSLALGDRKTHITPMEILLYVFTLGFVTDEIAKFWKVGLYYVGFWNVFNVTLYALVTASFVLRMIAIPHDANSDGYLRFEDVSYNLLAFSAPMFWMRLLLYIDTFRFFGAMLVVLKVMMKESLIFFALLVTVLVGFAHAFIGFDNQDKQLDMTQFIFKAMTNSILQSPDFDKFDSIAPPFGLILYYIFTFVVMVVLLNILVALYNSAYSDITDNANDEYMALFSMKCQQFVRAPDENVFIPPLNLLEILFLVIPFEWWMPKRRYERLNNAVMGILYSPLLIITAFIEQAQARTIRENRRRGEEDEDTIEEWEELGWKPEESDEEWVEMVKKSSPNVRVDPMFTEVQAMRKELKELTEMIKNMGNGASSTSSSSKRVVESSGGFGIYD